MQIGEVAKRSKVPIRTIRYYENIGVLPEPERTESGYRYYGPEVIDRLGFIRASQACGLSLKEIKEITAYRDRGEVPCIHVLELLQRRSKEIDIRITELEHARSVLDGLVIRAQKLRPRDCSPSMICHLIPTSNSEGELASSELEPTDSGEELKKGARAS